MIDLRTGQELHPGASNPDDGHNLSDRQVAALAKAIDAEPWYGHDGPRENPEGFATRHSSYAPREKPPPPDKGLPQGYADPRLNPQIEP